MKNSAIYAKTLPFSLLRVLIGFLGIVAGAIVTLAAFFFTKNSGADVNAIATGGGAIVGIVVFALIVKYLGYMLKAGQIAMITRGVAEGSIPDDAVAAGKEEVKKRFLTANVYFAVTAAISGITSQITRGVTAATGALGKATGNSDANNVMGAIGTAINVFISVVLEYVSYCCLGWVFLNKAQNAFKSTCDGAVIYFKNWKTLLKNAGKVIGITILSLAIIGGALGALNWAISDGIMSRMDPAELSATTTIPVTDDQTGEQTGEVALTTADMIHIGSVILSFLVWLLLHTAFIQPYILVSVMRSYIDSGKKTEITFDIYDKLCSLSKKFKSTFARSNTAAQA